MYLKLFAGRLPDQKSEWLRFPGEKFRENPANYFSCRRPRARPQRDRPLSVIGRGANAAFHRDCYFHRSGNSDDEAEERETFRQPFVYYPIPMAAGRFSRGQRSQGPLTRRLTSDSRCDGALWPILGHRGCAILAARP